MQGHMDTKLNEEGIKQAHMAAAALEKIPFKEAYSSDLSRAVKVTSLSTYTKAAKLDPEFVILQTAEIILSKHPAVGLKTCQELRERVSCKNVKDL